MENVEPKAVDELQSTRDSIKSIEGLFQAVNQASFPLRWYDAVINGMNFLNMLHTGLVAKLPESERTPQSAPAEVPKPIDHTPTMDSPEPVVSQANG